MAGRDRLAEFRAQGGPQWNHPQSTHENYELTPSVGRGRYAATNDQLNNAERGTDVNDGIGRDFSQTEIFLNQVESIREGIEQLETNIQKVQDLQNRQLNFININNTSQSNDSSQEVQTLRKNTTTLSNHIRNQLIPLFNNTANNSLPSDLSPSETAQRKTRLVGLQERFKSVLQRYQEVEKDSRDRQKARVERQARIVLGPDADEEKVQEAIRAEGDGEGVFRQALVGSYSEARSAYREIQQRNHDIQQIEKTLIELSQLSQDMYSLIMTQDDQLQKIEEMGQGVLEDTQKGTQELSKAKRFAEQARKKRWWCFFICLIIAIILGVVLGIYFGVVKN